MDRQKKLNQEDGVDFTVTATGVGVSNSLPVSTNPNANSLQQLYNINSSNNYNMHLMTQQPITVDDSDDDIAVIEYGY